MVLIHGGAHGPWCWKHLVPHLERAGADPVIAVDLIEDALAVAAVDLEELTIRHYIDGVVGRIEDADLRNLVLVGHSMAGITIPGVVHRIPDRVKRVIYLAASNPLVGHSVEDLMQDPLSPLSRGASFEDMFCNDLDAETARWLLSNLRVDPPGPFSEPVTQCSLPAGIPSTYVVFDRDLALLPEFQLAQAEHAQVDETRHFDAGHSGYISRPGALADLLMEYA